jgi:methionine synthase II (cobalamin-independent)
MKPVEITKEILIEDLVDHYAFSIRFLMEKGIRCIMCGEPIWGTLEEAAKEKGFTDRKIEDLVIELKRLAEIEVNVGTDAVLTEVSKFQQN